MSLLAVVERGRGVDDKAGLAPSLYTNAQKKKAYDVSVHVIVLIVRARHTRTSRHTEMHNRCVCVRATRVRNVVCVCVRGGVYVCLSVSVWDYVYIYVHICSYIHIFIYVDIYIYIYIYVCISIYLYVYICIYIYAHLTNHLEGAIDVTSSLRVEGDV